MSPFIWHLDLGLQFGWLANSGRTRWTGWNSFQIGRFVILWRGVKADAERESQQVAESEDK